MSSCNPCDPASCGGVPNSVALQKKLESMISDNYTLLFIFVVVMIILGLVFIYFVNSIKKNLKTYFKDKKAIKTSSGENPRIASDDLYTYYDNPKDDPEPVEPKTKMPNKTKEFVDKMESTYSEYNKLKSEYIKNTTMDRRKNDDIVDYQVLFKEHDNYKYEKDD